jgi:hypothetical protein
MEITIETDSYNQRRYGKPWIAKVDFSTDRKGSFEFGDWTGDGWNGGKGVLILNAQPGDIIATGQKDNRNPKNSAPEFHVVLADGSLKNIGDKGAAFKFYMESVKTESNPLEIFSDADILTEAKRRGLI